MLLKGRYLIEKELGRGGIGLVYLARDHHLHSRPVVIKVLLEGAEGDADRQWFQRKFLQEIEALARIDHPSVIGILDTGEMPDGQPFFVMQFVVGDSLRAAMKPGPMEFNRVAGLIRQMGNALDAAHEQGIIHRDLKPENIMLQRLSNGEDLVKLIDFGIATVKDSQIATAKERTAVAGTVAYMAPEQLLGKPTFRSDIYALGVIAYEMLTADRPFKPNSPFQLLDLQREGVRIKPRVLRPDLPQAAETAILRALAFDERERFLHVKDFGDQLADALTDSSSAKHRDDVEPIPPKSDLVAQMLAQSGRGNRAIGLRLWVEAEGGSGRIVRDFKPDLEPEMPRFKLGDRIAICALAERDCYLWIAAVGTSGASSIIFPQGVTNLVACGQTIKISGTITGQTGIETVHAFATTSAAMRNTSFSTSEALLQAEETISSETQRAESSAATLQFAVSE